MSSFIYKCEL